MQGKSRTFGKHPAAEAAIKEIADLAYAESVSFHIEDNDGGRRFVFTFPDEPKRKFVLGAEPSKRVAFIEKVDKITKKHDPA